MGSSKWKGAITVYFSIILSAVILLGGVLMDLVRIRTAEIQVRRAANTAALSVLAGFQPELKKEYGLFALHNNSTTYLNSELEKYLRANLSGLQEKKTSGLYLDRVFQKASFADLYDYRLEGIEVTPLYNFTENEITRQQIIEYMKYRAPVQLLDHFSQKLKDAAETASLGSEYEKKTEIEKKLKKVDTSLQWLQKDIEQMNAFKKDYFYSAQSGYSALKAYCNSLLIEQIYDKCRSIDFYSYINEENREDIAAIEEQIENAYSHARDAVEEQEELLQDQLQKAESAADSALQQIRRISQLTQGARQDLEALQKLLEEQGDVTGSKHKNSFEAAIRQDIEKYEALLDSESSESLLTQLERNKEVLHAISQRLQALPSLVLQGTAGIQSTALQQVKAGMAEGSYSGIGQSKPDAVYSLREFQELEEAARDYKQLPSIVENVKKNEGTDVRKAAVKAAKEILSSEEDSEKNGKKIEHPELLPSYFDGEKYPNKMLSDVSTIPRTETEAVQVPEADFGEDSHFVSQGFGYISNLGNMLKNSMAELGEELYVDEYILKVFKDEVEIKDEDTDGKSSDTYFDKAEVEYIINGNNSESANKIFVKGRILLIRFAVDTFYVYSNTEKRTQALQMATAAAGITGFGIPIVHNLIMCAWGTMEGISDVKELYEGKSVPFMKDENNWKTDLLPSGFRVNEKDPNNSNMMDFNYHDYLRLLLLVGNKETKMNRIEDLIQLNISKDQKAFMLKDSNTYIKATVQVSMKYWFLTKLFVPGRYKTEDGERHKIEIEVWKGY